MASICFLFSKPTSTPFSRRICNPTRILRKWDLLDSVSRHHQQQQRPVSHRPSQTMMAASARSVKPFISIHFRTGNGSPKVWYDPPRHQLSALMDFLDCAGFVERKLGMDPATTKWFLAADSASVFLSGNSTAQSRVADLSRSGKLVWVDENKSIVHVDRSFNLASDLTPLDLTFATFSLLQLSTASVISRSYFGELAAEMSIGKSQAFFYDGCVPVEFSAS
jgi:hypothetical protein